MRSQLFKKKVPETAVEKVCNCFGLSNVNEDRTFTREDIERDVCGRLDDLFPELKTYFLNCKVKSGKFTFQSSLTLIRQFLSVVNKKLKVTNTYDSKKKVRQYQVVNDEHGVADDVVSHTLTF